MLEGFRDDTAAVTRTKIIGSIWNYHQMSAIFRKMRMKQNEGQASIHMAEIEELQGLSQEEKELLSMSSRDRVELFKKGTERYTLSELCVTLRGARDVSLPGTKTRDDNHTGSKEASSIGGTKAENEEVASKTGEI